MDKVRIALCGKIRSGKDAVADYLGDKYGFKKFRFGDGIREVIRVLYPGEMEKGKPREKMQGVGQALRQYDPNVWLNYCLNGIEKSGKPLVIISDLRQPNEFERVTRDGWFTVRVTAPDELRIERARAKGDVFNVEDLNHDTERHVDGFPVDLEIVNDGSIERLYAAAEVAIVLAKAKKTRGEGFEWVP